MNRLAAELVLNAGRPGWKGLDAADVKVIRTSLADKVRDDPDFWSVISQTELRVYEAIAQGNLATDFVDKKSTAG